MIPSRDVVGGGDFADYPLQVDLVMAKNVLKWSWNPINFPEKSIFCIFEL